MDRLNNEMNHSATDKPDTGNDSNFDNKSNEQDNHTEIEQPNPSIATPGIPPEMPVREIR